MHALNQTMKLKASTMDSEQVIPLHLKQWMKSYIHAMSYTQASVGLYMI